MKVAAALAIAYVIFLPIAVGDRLHTQYLEIVENDFFRSTLEKLPAEVRTIVVPDDDLMRRKYHSTFEVMNKYRFIAAGAGVLEPALVGMTEYLEHPEAVDCANGACLFFAGIPCSGDETVPFALDECKTLVKERHGALLREAHVTAAPFAECSIYVGAAKSESCSKMATTFSVFQLR